MRRSPRGGGGRRTQQSREGDSEGEEDEKHDDQQEDDNDERDDEHEEEDECNDHQDGEECKEDYYKHQRMMETMSYELKMLNKGWGCKSKRMTLDEQEQEWERILKCKGGMN